ncbi:MAG: outer membrane lipoprotein carrier protein LolA [Bacteroidales bacterium]|nr:outer membrane lipoprotein carrier protein LolA [Bacteroidales bacterium]
MRKIFIISVFILIGNMIFAQYDSEAKSILDKVSEKTKAYSTIKIEFNSILKNLQDDIEETVEGVIYLKGNRYKLEIFENKIFSDGKTKWVYLPEVEEVSVYDLTTIDNEDNNDILNDPNKIFNIYEKGFKYKLMGEKSENGKIYYEIELVPENLDLNYFKIKINIDKEKLQLFSIKYFGKDGTRYTIILTKFDTNITLNDDMFIFDTNAHPNVEVIDMR